MSTQLLAAEAAANEPLLWFRLPPGFFDVDLTSLDDLSADLEPALPALETGVHPIAASAAGLFFEVLRELCRNDVLAFSVGIHPDDDEGACISMFSVSVHRVGKAAPRLAAAQAGLQLLRKGVGRELGVHFMDLPCGPAVWVESSLKPDGAATSRALPGVKTVPKELLQFSVAAPFPDGSRIAVLELTTASTAKRDDYLAIVLGVARTVSFSDPGDLEWRHAVESEIHNIFG